jgi:DNA-binding NarL/FixJ family response regulator
MKAITNRLRVFAFGISVAFLGLISPSKTLQAVDAVLNRQDWIDKEIDRVSR